MLKETQLEGQRYSQGKRERGRRSPKLKKTREDRRDKVMPTQHVSDDTEEGHPIASADLTVRSFTYRRGQSEPHGQQSAQKGEAGNATGH